MQQLSALRLAKHLAISYNQKLNVLQEGTIGHIPAHEYARVYVYFTDTGTCTICTANMLVLSVKLFLN